MVAQLESSIWQRIVDPSWDSLSPEAAEGLLRLKFRQADTDRMNQLGALAQEGKLNEVEKSELDTYIRIGRMISILQAQARLKLHPKQER